MTKQGDPIYRATIDTTFAVYTKRFFKRGEFYSALRFGGRCTTQHLPWYLDNCLPKDEEEYYRTTVNTHSWYFGDKSAK